MDSVFSQGTLAVLNHLRLTAAAMLLLATSLPAAELSTANPADVGFQANLTSQIDGVVEGRVKKQEIAGAIVVVARRGKVAHFKSYGFRNVDSGEPMTNDTLIRIYSMSKPIVTVAAMTLWEEGKFKLDDPVSKYLPELAAPKVYTGQGKLEGNLVPARREVSVRDLMRHTSGYCYGSFSNTPVDQLYRSKNVLDPRGTLADMVSKLGTIPLRHQPGTKFEYSVSSDVLGRLVEVLAGKSLDQVLQERVFQPLDMQDTGFYVKEEAKSRFSATHGKTREGKLKVSDAPATSRYRKRPTMLSGGGGLVSTARDYLRFCQMLLDGGKLAETRVLKAETVAMMTKNQMPDSAMPIGVGANDRRAGTGFGLGFSVRVAAVDTAHASGSVVGEFGWGGAASTHFWISPREQLIVITMRQFKPYQWRLEHDLKPIVHNAIAN
jgi:CubicO group peptidase (beta-lactamase class C family)